MRYAAIRPVRYKTEACRLDGSLLTEVVSYRNMTLTNSNPEWSGTSSGGLVLVRSMLYQILHDRQMIVLCGNVKRSGTIFVKNLALVSPMLHQILHNRQVALLSRDEERSRTIVVGLLLVRSLFSQIPQNRHVTVLS